MVEGLTVIVVAYGHARLVDACLQPVAASTNVIVVDNSQDAAVEAVARRHAAEYVDPGSNLGFAGGVNAGVRRAAADDDLLLLNPDASITQTGIEELRHALRSGERVAAVAPLVIHPETGVRERVSWPFPTPGGMWRESLRLPVCESSGFLMGACLLISRDAWNDVGGFDERFFLYAEETDWQFRAALRGWHLRQVVDVTATHLGAASSEVEETRERLFFAGTETYMRKWYGTSGWMSFRTAVMVGAAARSMMGNAETRRRARQRLGIFARGPRRAAGIGSA